MKISVKKLQRLGACVDQVEAFERIFGDAEVTVTEALCVKHAPVFDWDWAAENLLDDAAQDKYCCATAPAWKEYRRAIAAAWEEYERVEAWEEYERVEAAAFGKLAEQQK